MKTIIAGSRSITDYDTVCEAIKESGFHITEVISGTAQGVDRLGEKYAEYNNIPIIRFPADWKKHGRSAGPIRNEQMAQIAEAVICVWDGSSKGTKNMISIAKRKGLKLYAKEIHSR